MPATPYYRVDDAHTGELGREIRIFGPPGCLAGPTLIPINRAGKGGKVRLDHLVTCFNGGKPSHTQGAKHWDTTIPTFVQRDVGDTIRLGRVESAWQSGVKEVFVLTTAGGRSIAATAEHPFLTDEGWAKLGELRAGAAVKINAGQQSAGRKKKAQYAATYTRFHPRQRPAKGGHRMATHRLVAEATLNSLEFPEYLEALRTDPERCATFTYLTPDLTVHHRNLNHRDNRPENLEILTGGQAAHAAEHNWADNVLHQTGTDTVATIRRAGWVPTFDLEVADDPHCFVANGLVVHNTGKTTFLEGSIRNTALLRGSDNVLVASFTVAAAAELQGRGLPLPKSQVGTLHSLAYRCLERPPVAEEMIDEWNMAHPAFSMTQSARRVNADDGQPVEAGAGATEGDALSSRLDSLRARLVPRDDWPPDVALYAKTWETWKQANGLIDFTDMIEMALYDVEVAPGHPDAGFFDEVQDFTPLELALIRKWGAHMERIIMAGDDDQTLYSFKGASPEGFLTPEIPDGDKIVLSQSWRIPAAVHRAAEHWIRQVGHRENKRYDPRAEEGLVRHIPVSFAQPQMLADQIEASLGTVDVNNDGIEQPATVMVLAPCSYMIDPLKHELRARGLPFSNPWRRSRGDWNPMRPGTPKQVSSRERLLAYLILDEREFGDKARLWTGEDVRKWAAVVKKQGIFRRGAQAAIDALPTGELDFEAHLAPLFVDEIELDQAVTPDLRWYERNLLASKRAGMGFPIEVARKRGATTLTTEPRVFIGTIHSFKGAQATCVYLIPDLSARGSNEWRQRGAPADAVRRQFYVGMTRARRELAVCEPATTLHVSPELIIAGARPGSA